MDKPLAKLTPADQSNVEGARFDPASLRCAEALPVNVIASSRDLGWRSGLVEYQQVLACEDGFETLPTLDHTIVVMTGGEQELEARTRGRWQREIYRPGSVGMTLGGEIDCLRRRVNRDAGPARKVNIYAPQLFFAEAADHLGRAHLGRPAQSLTRPGHSDAVLCHTSLALLRAMQAGVPDVYLESILRWLALHLLTFAESVPTTGDGSHREAISDKRLARVLDCITDRYAEALSLDVLAAEAGVSKFHFVRLFRRATGTTPHRYLQDRRLDAAQRMLRTTDTLIGEVSRQCGFARSNHFATQFAERFGMSPSGYRLSVRGTI